MENIEQALKKAANISGNFSCLAVLLGVTPQTIRDWKIGRRPIPAKRAMAIEQITHGKVLREELVPNWHELWIELIALDRLGQRERESTHHVSSIDTLP